MKYTITRSTESTFEIDTKIGAFALWWHPSGKWHLQREGAKYDDVLALDSKEEGIRIIERSVLLAELEAESKGEK